MPTLEIEIPGEAKPQGSKSAFVIQGRAVLVEASKDLKPRRAAASAIIHKTAYENKWVRVEKPNRVVVMVDFYFERPPTVKREHLTITPDLDKLFRFIGDALTDAGNVLEDDSQITHIDARKMYGDKAKTIVKVWTDDV
jgi:Holliday junction resolvase RusA-like endonuclease